MKRQLKGIALLLGSILLMIGYGEYSFFDLSFDWSAIFAIIGIAGAAIVFMPDKKD
mgnify:CR=1 FL=1